MAKRAKKAKKKEMKTIDVTDPLGQMLIKSDRAVSKGIGPKNKQNSMLEILGESSLEVVDENGKMVDLASKNGEIEWKDIKSISKRYRLDTPVEDWSNQKLFIYFGKIYYDKYGQNHETAVLPGIETIKVLKAEFTVLLGYKISNQDLKSYLEWLMTNGLDDLIARVGNFRLRMLKDKTLMKRFIRVHEWTPNVIEVTEINVSSMEELFSLDKIEFLVKYGAIIAMKWLVAKQNCSIERSKKIVMDLLKDSIKEGESTLAKIAKTTESLSPYPMDCNLAGIGDLLAVLKVNEVLFSNEAKSLI